MTQHITPSDDEDDELPSHTITFTTTDGGKLKTEIEDVLCLATGSPPEGRRIDQDVFEGSFEISGTLENAEVDAEAIIDELEADE